MASPLRQRLLQDIAELQTKPYPNIALHVQDEDITKACLVLTVDGYGPMHLTVFFPETYPLQAPEVQMNSQVVHPNIFGTYICASILNTSEGYTPAYTLKGIAIQLLSFFSSDKVEQNDYGSGVFHSIGLAEYRDRRKTRVMDDFQCSVCSFSNQSSPSSTRSSLGDYFTAGTRDYLARSDSGSDVGGPSSSSGRRSRRRKANHLSVQHADAAPVPVETPVTTPSDGAFNPTPDTLLKTTKTIQTVKVPDEILLMIIEHLDFEELTAFAQSWPRIAKMVHSYDIVRTRELQCFCFKKDYNTTGLGVGVDVVGNGKFGFIQSEFDLLSLDAFRKHKIRTSVFGVPFTYWLPLPISNAHWDRKVRNELTSSLSDIAKAANISTTGSPAQVIFHFMNDVVVKLNEVADRDSNSSLSHASEKAIESYFHLFHLLLCMAVSNPGIVRTANDQLNSFLNGKNDKTHCPDLGHLLVAALIADVPMDEKLLKAIIRETITRNVVWMLKEKPELSYLEPSAVSDYRLKETFTASQTSYRLLMFLNLFRRTAVGSPRTKSLFELCNEAFDRHGAPPRGAAKGLADSIKRIHRIQNFPDFLVCMGLEKPGPIFFTRFLRDCVVDSEKKGYHQMPISQEQALALRHRKERGVEVARGLFVLKETLNMQRKSFFPGRKDDGRGNRGGRGGRVGWRGGRRN